MYCYCFHSKTSFGESGDSGEAGREDDEPEENAKGHIQPASGYLRSIYGYFKTDPFRTPFVVVRSAEVVLDLTNLMVGSSDGEKGKGDKSERPRGGRRRRGRRHSSEAPAILAFPNLLSWIPLRGLQHFQLTIPRWIAARSIEFPPRRVEVSVGDSESSSVTVVNAVVRCPSISVAVRDCLLARPEETACEACRLHLGPVHESPGYDPDPARYTMDLPVVLPLSRIMQLFGGVESLAVNLAIGYNLYAYPIALDAECRLPTSLRNLEVKCHRGYRGHMFSQLSGFYQNLPNFRPLMENAVGVEWEKERVMGLLQVPPLVVQSVDESKKIEVVSPSLDSMNAILTEQLLLGDESTLLKNVEKLNLSGMTTATGFLVNRIEDGEGVIPREAVLSRLSACASLRSLSLVFPLTVSELQELALSVPSLRTIVCALKPESQGNRVVHLPHLSNLNISQIPSAPEIDLSIAQLMLPELAIQSLVTLLKSATGLQTLTLGRPITTSLTFWTSLQTRLAPCSTVTTLRCLAAFQGAGSFPRIDYNWRFGYPYQFSKEDETEIFRVISSLFPNLGHLVLRRIQNVSHFAAIVGTEEILPHLRYLRLHEWLVMQPENQADELDVPKGGLGVGKQAIAFAEELQIPHTEKVVTIFMEKLFSFRATMPVSLMLKNVRVDATRMMKWLVLERGFSTVKKKFLELADRLEKQFMDSSRELSLTPEWEFF